MALELETQIMMEIGFGNHYTWYNGSLSCKGIRIEAAAKLPLIIQIHHDRGEEVAAPDYNLTNTLRCIAAEGDDTVLTRTWEAASYIIAEHIHKAKASPKEQIAAFKRLNEHLKKHYISDETKNRIFEYDNTTFIIYNQKDD